MPAKTLVQLLRERPTLLKVGVIFSLVAVFIAVFMAIVFSTLGHEVPDASYEEISARGIGTTATITNIETQYNVTINNVHPTVISYTYTDDGTYIESKFKTLSPDEVSRLKIGDPIPIRHLNGVSVITTLEPFRFPYGLFFLIPVIFLLIGLSCFGVLIYQIRNETHLPKLRRRQK